MKELNKNALTNWKLEYSMSDSYKLNLDVINAKLFSELAKKLRSDSDLFAKYFLYNNVLLRKKSLKQNSRKR